LYGSAYGFNCIHQLRYFNADYNINSSAVLQPSHRRRAKHQFLFVMHRAALMEMILLELVKETKPGEFAQSFLLFIVAWTIMRRTIAGHFEKIEMQLGRVSDTVESLADAMKDMENKQTQRISLLEQRVGFLDEKFDLLGKGDER
jgi:hypothetical protein